MGGGRSQANEQALASSALDHPATGPCGTSCSQADGAEAAADNGARAPPGRARSAAATNTTPPLAVGRLAANRPDQAFGRRLAAGQMVEAGPAVKRVVAVLAGEPVLPAIAQMWSLPLHCRLLGFLWLVRCCGAGGKLGFLSPDACRLSKPNSGRQYRSWQ